MSDTSRLLEEQKAYYHERAPEYDDWWLRSGRHDRGPEFRSRWINETNEVRAALAAFGAYGRILEIACGTGWWTQQLAEGAKEVTALDASSEMLERCRARVETAGLGAERVRYVQADLWDWTPERRHDEVFFGFWLSHVPEERFDAFWALVDAALVPDGRVFFVDSAASTGSSGASGGGSAAETELREIAGGRRFEIVKRYYEPRTLRERLAALGWEFEVRTTAEFFLHAQGRRG
ncbi:MAG: class I SAM-dependent methyltransferase [Chloroflexi bacterium]|nr:class I SAM-dependent methyltransferase [Chloroflexota bacterium]